MRTIVLSSETHSKIAAACGRPRRLIFFSWVANAPKAEESKIAVTQRGRRRRPTHEKADTACCAVQRTTRRKIMNSIARLLLLCVVMCAQAQEEYGQQSSSAAPQAQTTPAEQPQHDPHTHDSNGKPYVLPGEDEWTAQKRRLQESGRSGSSASRGMPGQKKRKRKKSWLTLLGVGGEDGDGKPKP